MLHYYFVIHIGFFFFFFCFYLHEKQNLLEIPEKTEGTKPTKAQQLKKVFKEYGAVGVSFHICISLVSLGMFYLFISR